MCNCPVSVAVGDFNGDGRPDLAVANSVSNNVSILLGNANGTFQARVNYAVRNGPSSVAVGDFNADGRPDLAVANSSSQNVSILLGNPPPSAGTFQAPVNYAAGSSPFSVAVGDFNADGRPDLAVVNNTSSGNVSVFLNTTPRPVIITQQPAPVSVCPSGTAAFSVTAAGTGPFTYQWQWRPLGSTVWSNIVDGVNTQPGTTTPAFNASAVTQVTVTMTNSVGSSTAVTGGRREIQVIVTNPCGSVSSNAATWTICPADFNCSGTLSVQDIFDFLAAWFASAPAADFNGVNGITPQDIFDFLAAWFAGCS